MDSVPGPSRHEITGALGMSRGLLDRRASGNREDSFESIGDDLEEATV
jgi:hypothetical protein